MFYGFYDYKNYLTRFPSTSIWINMSIHVLFMHVGTSSLKYQVPSLILISHDWVVCFMNMRILSALIPGLGSRLTRTSGLILIFYLRRISHVHYV